MMLWVCGDGEHVAKTKNFTIIHQQNDKLSTYYQTRSQFFNSEKEGYSKQVVFDRRNIVESEHKNFIVQRNEVNYNLVIRSFTLNHDFDSKNLECSNRNNLNCKKVVIETYKYHKNKGFYDQVEFVFTTNGRAMTFYHIKEQKNITIVHLRYKTTDNVPIIQLRMLDKVDPVQVSVNGFFPKDTIPSDHNIR